MAYSMRELKAIKGWFDKKCMWCGEYFKQGDKLALIVPLYEYKKKYKKLEHNVIMHLEEYNELLKECEGSKDMLLYKIATHKTKRTGNSLTAEQTNEGEAFKQACKDMGFNTETNTKDEIHMRKGGTSLILAYNPRTKRIHISKRGKARLFDGLFMREIEVTAYNRMHTILGDGKNIQFSAQDEIDKAVYEANNIVENNK